MPASINSRFDPTQTSLFLDVDGTLIDFAPTPDSVVVPAELVATLDALDRSLDGALALVSGRTVADLDALFAPLDLSASGVHGAEIKPARRLGLAATARPSLPEAAWERLMLVLEDFPGTLAENKRYSFAVHYRGLPFVDDLAGALTDYVASYPELRLELVGGHLVFEIKLPGFDKGRAIARIMEIPPFAGRRPVFVADDELDRAGFAEVLKQGGLAYCVGQRRSGLSGWFPDPTSVREWLAAHTLEAAGVRGGTPENAAANPVEAANTASSSEERRPLGALPR